MPIQRYLNQAKRYNSWPNGPEWSLFYNSTWNSILDSMLEALKVAPTSQGYSPVAVDLKLKMLPMIHRWLIGSCHSWLENVDPTWAKLADQSDFTQYAEFIVNSKTLPTPVYFLRVSNAPVAGYLHGPTAPLKTRPLDQWSHSIQAFWQLQLFPFRKISKTKVKPIKRWRQEATETD